MGFTKVNLKIFNAKDEKRMIEIPSIIADTGSILTWVREDLLEKIGIERKWKDREFTLMSGKVKRDIGIAICGIDGEMTACDVVFGKEGDANVVGVTALESMGFEVDPVTQKLKKVGLLAL